MKLVKEIRDGAVDSSIELSTVLRKAKILALALRNEEFSAWVANELDGYPPSSEVPRYREVTSPLTGTFTGPFAIVRNQLIPISTIPEALRENAISLQFTNSVREIESLSLSKKVDGLRRPWPPEAVSLLQKFVELTGGCVLIEAYQPIQKSHLDGILGAIRNRLLDFMLALQQIEPAILDSEDALHNLPEEKVSQVFHVSIFGNHNVLASGAGFHQSVSQGISPNDEAALLGYLKHMGLSEDDLAELKAALKGDGTQPKGQFGERVKRWMGKVLVKAIDGTWKIATSAAPDILTKALSEYYGWS